MASTFSGLKIELIGTGEQAGTWGTTTNTNLGTAIEEAITGRATATFPSDANYTLPYIDTNSAQIFRNLVLNVVSAGSLGATRDLIIPAIEKQYIVENNTSGSQSIRIKTAAGTGVTIPNGRTAHVYCNGVDTRFADDFVDINGGSIDGTPIGVSSASTGNFTTVTATDVTTTNLNLTSPLGVTSGGTGLATATQGDILYASASNTYVALPKNTTATRYLANTGTSNNPAWAQVDLTNGVTGDLPLTNLAQGTALSVLGVTGNATADNASIVAASDHQVLRRSGTSVAFGAVALNQTNAVTGTLPVANGGTGVATLTANSVLLGNGTTAVQTVAPGATGNLLTSNGTTWTSAAPPTSFVSGMIIMWSGSIASIPSGWVLCNGSNGTPDLRDRFVVGAGSTYAVGATGGSANAVAVSHTHTFSTTTNTTGDHSHTYDWGVVASGTTSKPYTSSQTQAISFSPATSTAGAHNHTVSGTTDSTGSSGTNANLPPYYALAYIMKT